MTPEHPAGACLDARQWLSAARDGETAFDPDRAGHVRTCPACSRWSTVLDTTTRTARLRAPEPPPLTAALPTLPSAGRHDHAPLLVTARHLLLVAVASAAVAAVLGITGIAGNIQFGTAGDRQAWTVKFALVAGFAFAWWRPGRFAAGVLPIAMFAVVVHVAISINDVAVGRFELAEELLHLPIVIGAVGTLLACVAVTHRQPNNVVAPTVT